MSSGSCWPENAVFCVEEKGWEEEVGVADNNNSARIIHQVLPRIPSPKFTNTLPCSKIKRPR